MIKEIFKFAGMVSAIALVSIATAGYAKADNVDDAKNVAASFIYGTASCGINTTESETQLVLTTLKVQYGLSEAELYAIMLYLNAHPEQINGVGRLAFIKSGQTCATFEAALGR